MNTLKRSKRIKAIFYFRPARISMVTGKGDWVPRTCCSWRQNIDCVFPAFHALIHHIDHKKRSTWLKRLSHLRLSLIHWTWSHSCIKGKTVDLLKGKMTFQVSLAVQALWNCFIILSPIFVLNLELWIPQTTEIGVLKFRISFLNLMYSRLSMIIVGIITSHSSTAHLQTQA